MSEYTSIKENVLTQLEILLPELREWFVIETIGIFRSVARGEDTPESDVDVLYCFQKGRGGMFDLAGLHDYLVSSCIHISPTCGSGFREIHLAVYCAECKV